MTLAFAPLAPIIVPVTTGAGFPVRRVFCIGRNYAAHAREMGSDPDREPPFFFTKWAEAVVPSGTEISYPPETSSYHFEAELVVAIGKPGRNITPEAAQEHIFGYACGLDMTRRDLQNDAKGKGRPWDIGKNVEQSAPIGLIRPAAQCPAMDKGAVTLTCNGDTKQTGDLGEMIWPVGDVVAYISRFYELQPGDLIYTGTPEGVGPIIPGDVLTVHIDGLDDLTITIGGPK